MRRSTSVVIASGWADFRWLGGMNRRYMTWRNRHAADERLRKVVGRAHVA